MVGSTPDAWGWGKLQPWGSLMITPTPSTAHDAAEACALSGDSTYKACLSDGLIWLEPSQTEEQLSLSPDWMDD